MGRSVFGPVGCPAASGKEREASSDIIFASGFGQAADMGSPQFEGHALPAIALHQDGIRHFNFLSCCFGSNTMAEAGARRKAAPVAAA